MNLLKNIFCRCSGTNFLAGLSVLVLVSFSGCKLLSDSDTVNADKDSEKSEVSFEITSGMDLIGTAGTVCLVLSGTPAVAGPALLHKVYDTYKKLSADKTAITPGFWTFTLSVQCDGVCTAEASVTTEIPSGGTTVGFNLAAVEAADGSLQINLSYPVTEPVALIRAGLYTYPDKNEIPDMLENLVPADAESGAKIESVSYVKKRIPAGRYYVRFVFYADTAGTSKLLESGDTIEIVSGKETLKNYDFDTVTGSYTISYHLAEGSWATGFTALTVFSVAEEVKLPETGRIVKTGYDFAGWYTDKNCTDTSGITGWKAGEKKSDIEVWAKWTEKVVTLSFDLAGGKMAAGESDRMSGMYGSPFTVTNPVRTGYVFAGWDPALPDSFPPVDTTYTAVWNVPNSTPVQHLTGGYDCTVKKIGLMWQLPDSVQLKEIHLGWSRLDETETHSVTLSGQTDTWQLDNVAADSSVYRFTVSTVDMADSESSAQSADVTASFYFVGQVIYVFGDGSFSGVVSGTPAGIIFETEHNGCDYKMVALKNADRKKIAWSKNGTCYYRASVNSLVDGRLNMIAAETYCRTKHVEFNGQNYPALYYGRCYDADTGGLSLTGKSTGWYLPARDELNAIYSRKPVLEAVLKSDMVPGDIFSTDDTYWSSSQSLLETSKSKAWTVSLFDGKDYDHSGDVIYRTYERYVRAVYASAPLPE